MINGNDANTTVEIRGSGSTYIENVTVTGGHGLNDPTFGSGCGGFKIQDSDVEIVNSRIERNSAGTGPGGAVCAAGDSKKLLAGRAISVRSLCCLIRRVLITGSGLNRPVLMQGQPRARRRAAALRKLIVLN